MDEVIRGLSRLRAPFAAALVAAFAAALAPTEAVGSSTTSVVITGRGWGHGMGMAQWGAYGYAQHGWDYRRILRHYYPGTTTARSPHTVVKVLLFTTASTVRIESVESWHVTDGKGRRRRLPAMAVDLGKTLRILGNKVMGPLVFTPGIQPILVDGIAYRGSIRVSRVARHIEVVDLVELEDYVAGVVGGEMPPAWPRTALQAQAVATRTYALSQIARTEPDATFDLFDDTRSQVYGGIPAEFPETNDAVRSTRRVILTYRGRPAETFFSSSSGGMTVSSAEQTGSDVPYLRSVVDPFDALSPDHEWSPVVLRPGKAGALLRLGGPLLGAVSTIGASGHLLGLSVTGSHGAKTLTGEEARSALHLRSTWFRLGIVTLKGPDRPVAHGSKVILSGTIEGDASGISLEARTDRGWRRVARVRTGPSGVFNRPIAPRETTEYRLAVGTIGLRAITVRVARRAGYGR